MSIQAIFQSGVFKPLNEVSVKENQRVRLEILPDNAEIAPWLARVQIVQNQIKARAGEMPDSSPLIAEDRQR